MLPHFGEQLQIIKIGFYYFDSSTTPNIFWVSLDNIDFKEGGTIKKLSIAKGGKILSGEVLSYFESAEPFKFLAGQVE